MVMKKNIGIVTIIIMLFIAVFFLGNRDYFQKESLHIVHNGITQVDMEALQDYSVIKLNGDWSFYPNRLIAPNEVIGNPAVQRLTLAVPSDWSDFVHPKGDEPVVGTYYVRIKVPTEGQYGLYIRTIRQANRIFINGEEVGGMGNPTESLQDFKRESDDRYTVFARSENLTLDVVIHVGNYNYSKAGILYPIEFGTKAAIQRHYLLKVLADAFVSIGFIVFGVIYIISYSQNRKRKEELFFGLFTILLGLYMSFINQKVFFLFFSMIDVTRQVQLQLGILPLVVVCLILFIYYMYPEFVRRRTLYSIIFLLGFLVYEYGINYLWSSTKKVKTPEELLFSQVFYVALIVPLGLYTVFVLARVLQRNIAGSQYILIFLTSLACYAVLLASNFLFGVTINFSELLLFSLMVFSFASLLSFRANEAYKKAQALSEELFIYNQMKDEFLLKTSHELRTPLNGILNLSKALMEGEQEPLKRVQQEQVILIHNVTQRLGYLVEDLLFSSNQMNEDIRITPSAVQISMIDEVIAEMCSLMPKNTPVRLVSAIDPNLPAMYTDELRMKQVLYNLLHNAIKHTSHGQITIAATTHKDKIKISVSDTGRGIPSDELERVFNSFYRVKKGANSEGLGLGLSIAKNIVEKLNGEIFVTSTLGYGTTFTFTMPIATPAQLLNMKEQSVVFRKEQEKFQLELPLFFKGNDKTILVVDDDHVNIKVLIDALIKRGYTCIAVDNGFDAIDYLKTHKVDCLLIDLMLPHMSGYELCKKVREQYDLLELPIIVLTAIMKHSDLMLSLQVGASEYLQKPIIMDELFMRIESHLAVRQASLDAIEDELNYLYTQVSPHFVYNTLNTIIGLSYSSIENTREALYCLATYFRAKLNIHYRKNLVSLEEEIDFVKAYLYIEKMRFGDRLTINYDIDEMINCKIPALSLQPLIENAVFHGISKKEQGGMIELSVQREGQFVCIKIDDNGIGIPQEKLQQLLNEENSRIGFTNPLKKFKLIKNASLHISSEEGKGTTVIILLPEGDVE